MKILNRAGTAGFFVVCVLMLSACDGATVSTNPALQNDGTQTPVDPTTGDPNNETPQNPVTPTEPQDPAGPTTPVVEDPVEPTNPGVPEVPVVTDPEPEPERVPVEPQPPINAQPIDSGSFGDLSIPNPDGVDMSGGDDDSPTVAETISLVGPFVKDTTRSAGPPSAPKGLTLLMASDNWVEFTWVPSVDDQSVEEYEIYRDNQRIGRVRGDSGNALDYSYWLSTSFMDCNYTRSAICNSSQPASGASYSYSVAAIDNEGMRSERSEPVVFSLEQKSSAPVNLDGYTQVFAEEFNGSELDRSQWKTSLPWGPDRTINAEEQYFVNTFGNNPPAYNPFVFTGETLRITGDRTPVDMLSSVNNKPYVSGVITTSDYFEMTYGYVEMSAKVAQGQGLLSTFYLFNQNFEKNQPEIDILEYIGSRPNKTYQTYHYYDSIRARYANGEKHSTPTMEYVAPEDLSRGFHTYGVMWKEGLVIWYVDGQEVRRLAGPRVSDEPMNIIAQLVMGSEWIGSPEASAIPAVFEIDYIRAWQQ